MWRFLTWINNKKSKILRKWQSSIVTGTQSEDLFGNEYLDYHHLPFISGSENTLVIPSNDWLPRKKTSEMTDKLKEQQSRNSVEIDHLNMVNEKLTYADTAFPTDKITSSTEVFYDAVTPESSAHYNDYYEPLLIDGCNQLSKSAKVTQKLRFNIPRISLSTTDNYGDKKILLDVTSPKTLNTESVNDSVSDCGSVTTLAVGLVATTNVTSISAPVTPYGSGTSLHHEKTFEFDGVGKSNDMILPRALTDIERRKQLLTYRRQSNVQLVHSVSGRRTSTTLIPLTTAQIHLVRVLWRQTYVNKGPTLIGETIIHRLFFKLPKTRDQFRRCPLPQNFLNHDSFSKAHSKALAELIDAVVENLANLEVISEKLERVGRMHAQILRGELSSKIWNTVAETFIDCTLEWGDKRCRSEIVRKAWALITAFLIERIRSGHLEERKDMLSMRATIVAFERMEVNCSGSVRANT